MDFQGQVVLLTGGAGTGKSSLAKELSAAFKPLHKVDFGQLLLERKIRQGMSSVTYEDLRRDSAGLITVDDVRAVEEELLEALPGLRRHTHVLIDSHAVTKESYGYRVTHYSFDQLKRLSLNAVIVTYCDPTELVARFRNDPQGRPEVSEFEALHYMALQEGVAINYAITCGCPCYFLRTTDRSPEDLALEILGLLSIAAEPSQGLGGKT
jgi:adenylate kinase